MVFWCLFYAIVGWSAVLEAAHFELGVKIYAVDVVLALLLIRAAFTVATTKQPAAPVRWFALYELVVIAFAAYALEMANPPAVVAGQARVLGLYASGFLVAYLAVKEPADLSKLELWGVRGIATVLVIGGFRLVTGHGIADEQFSANPGDVRRFLSYYESAFISVFYYWLLVRVARRRPIMRWQWLMGGAVVAGLLVSNYRSVWTATIVLTGSFLLWESRRSLVRASRLVALGLALAGGGYTVTRVAYAGVVHAKFGAKNLSGGITGRLTMWIGAVSRIRAHPFFGSGMGYFKLFQGHIHTLHNDWLQLLQNFGALGTLIAITVILKLRQEPQEFDALASPELSDYRDFRTATRLAIGGICAVSLLEPFLLQPQTIIVLFAILGAETKIEWTAIQARKTPATHPSQVTPSTIPGLAR